MLSHGADGLRQASEDAVLSANYIRASLKDVMSAPFGERACMHEALFDDRWLQDTGMTTLDFAKAMIDEGFHPMTVYFPLVVHGAMLIEPTEIGDEGEPRPVHHDLAGSRISGEGRRSRAIRDAPIDAPRRRLDETRAARKPVLRWTKPSPPDEAPQREIVAPLAARAVFVLGRICPKRERPERSARSWPER